MATLNHHNGPVTVTGNVCAVTVYPYPLALASVAGQQTSGRLFRALSWLIVPNAAAVGSIVLQLIDPLTGTYYPVTLAPFPITLVANSTPSVGRIALDFQGARFSVTLTAGQLSVCELIAEDEDEID